MNLSFMRTELINLGKAIFGIPIVSSGDTAWVLTAAALVMLMTPALGFFYAGLVRQKNVLTLLIQCYFIFAAVGLVWALFGFTLAFGESTGHIIGNFKYVALSNVGGEPYDVAPTIPAIVFFFFELCACAITPALIIGSPAERFSLIPSVVFSCVWVIIVYCPICHWVFNSEGWLFELGAVDFGGGMVVHMSAGFSALALAIVTGKREVTSGKMIPSNISYSVLGAALLWFGWFGYNGGSSFAANARGGLAIVNTNLSASAAGVSWAIVDYIFKKRVSALGIAVGSVCGMIAMTAGCGFCPAWSSIIIGLFGGAFSNLFVTLREKYHLFDDSLDVFGCHGICGTWGVLATGLFAYSSEITSEVNGAFFGNIEQLGNQLIGIVAVAVYSFAMTIIIGFAMRSLHVLRVDKLAEEKGLDQSTYGEAAYEIIPSKEIEMGNESGLEKALMGNKDNSQA